jgi:hypothetical protein
MYDVIVQWLEDLQWYTTHYDGAKCVITSSIEHLGLILVISL